MKPIIKWAGGKTRMLKHILPIIPKNIENYYEPFFGGGALYINISFKKAYINDFNNELINLYQVVKKQPHKLIKLLEIHLKQDSKKHFLEVRDEDRKTNFWKGDVVSIAARTIYLNKSGYGGLYRVNSKGFFNVPYAENINGKEILNKKNILLWSERLNKTNTKITSMDFQKIIDKTKKGDFLYLDPPYFEWNGTANFTAYTKEGFNMNDQIRLRNSLINADKRGVKFILTNSGTDKVIKFYSMFKTKKVPIVRTIAASKNKRGFAEVIVSNF